MCAFTFIPIKEWNEMPICDFTVMQEMETTSIVLLTDEEQPSLILVSMPGIRFTVFIFLSLIYNIILYFTREKD